MDDIEERPSKIRKISEPEESDATLRNLLEANNGTSIAPHNPIISKPQDEDIPGTKTEIPGQGGENEGKPILSKSQLKKLRKKEQWEAGKDDRRLKRREKHKEKQARKATARAELAAQATSGEVPSPSSGPNTQPQNGQAKGRGPKRPIQVPLSLVLDCDFNDLMTEKELISLGAQLTRCYSENRSAVYRTHLAVSSWGGSLQERFEGPLAKNHLAWKGVRFIPENFVAAAVELNGHMRGLQGGNLVGALKGDEAEETEGPEPEEEEVIEVKETNSVEFPARGLLEEIAKKVDAKEIDSVEAHIEKLLQPETTGSATKDVTESKVEDVDQHLLESNGTKTLNESDPEPSEPQEPSARETPLPPPSLIYLTSDSPHTLTTLSPHTSYIIGGIVDKNRHKGLCYKRAKSLGISTAKLPIGEYMTMQSRSVLAVNHVVEIMLRWLELGDWGKAFLRVIPKRKDARLKARKGEGEEQGGEEDDDESDGVVRL